MSKTWKRVPEEKRIKSPRKTPDWRDLRDEEIEDTGEDFPEDDEGSLVIPTNTLV